MLRPRSRGFLWLVGLLALVLIGVVAVVFSQNGDMEGLSSVAEAAERTSAEPGGQIEAEMTYSVSADSSSVTSTGSGVFDRRSGRARFELTVQGADGSPLKVESVGDEKTAFVSSRVLSEELPPGKEWLGMEPLLGHDPTTALSAGGGAKGSLEMLRAVGGDVERVGEETVRGENTTQYKGTVDLAQAAKKFAAEGDVALARLDKETADRLSGPLPVEVWIGVGGLVRRERLIERMATDGGQAVEMDLRMEFFDFAAHPNIALPPRHVVLDYTPVLRAELGMMDGTSLGSLKPAAGAVALSVPDFRRRLTGICRATLAKGRSVIDEGHRFDREFEDLGRPAPTTGAGKSLLLQIGRWLEGPVYRLGTGEVAELAAVAPPSKYAADYHHYLAIYAQQAEWALAQARAFQLGTATVPGTEGQTAEEARWKAELKRLADKMGIRACEKEVGSGSSSQAT